jgi:hypothetical protein
LKEDYQRIAIKTRNMKRLYIFTLLSLILLVNQSMAQWNSLNAPSSNYETYGVLSVSVDGKNLFSFESDISGNGYFVTSHDYGSTWQKYIQTKVNYNIPTAPVDNSTIFWEGDVLYYTSADGTFRKSVDFGATVSTVESQPPSYRPILRTPDGKWYQPGSGYWHVSTDKGLSWNTIPNGIDAIAYLTAKNGNIIGLISNGGIGYSEDSGATWKASTLPAGTIWQYTSITKATDGTLLALYYSSPSILLKSTDNGITWQKVDAAIPANTKVICYCGNDVIAYSILGTTYKSTDGGLTFAALNSKQIMMSITSMISNGKNIYLYGMTGIYIYGNTPTGIQSMSADQWSVFPNPCKNSIHLESAEKFSSYILADLTGKIVSRGSITDNEIDISYISAGFYILSTTNKDGQMSAIKLVKE